MKMPLFSSSHVSQIQFLYPNQIKSLTYYFQPWTQDEYEKIKSSEGFTLPERLPALSDFSQKLLHFYTQEGLSGHVLSLGAGISNIEARCIADNPKIESISCVDIEPFMNDLSRIVPQELAGKMRFYQASILDEKRVTELLSGQKFDSIMINQLIYALSDEQVHALVSLCEKVLKPNGNAYLVCSSQLNWRTALQSLKISLRTLLGKRLFKPIGVLRSDAHLISIFKRHPRFKVTRMGKEIPLSYRLTLKPIEPERHS